MKKRIYENLLACTDEAGNLSSIEFDGETILNNVTKYNLFEDKILAVKSEGSVYVYLVYVNKDANTVDIQFERLLLKYGDLEGILLMCNEHQYRINFNCDIICEGRK